VSRAIKKCLYIAEISVQVEKLYSTAFTTQCQKCQSFRHLNNYCHKSAICELCAESHSIKQHSCNMCKAKGTCNHLQLKNSNCCETYSASFKVCKILLAVKAKSAFSITLQISAISL